MRGYLSFILMYLLSRGERYGQQLASEIARRKADRPNPGTIYPALRKLEAAGIITSRKRGRARYYRLTRAGRRGLREAAEYFHQAYGDIVDAYRAGEV